MSTRRRRLHIVVTCANRKRHPVHSSMHLRRTPGKQPRPRVTRWVHRLTSSRMDSIPARDLYAGEHWDIARSLPDMATGFARPALWIASAGWGLIPSDAPIQPYSATFTTRHPDSVADDAAGRQQWWDALAAWDGPTPGAPRSLTELVTDHPRDRVLVVLSEPYFTACSGDLADALNAAHESMISVIAAGVAAEQGWADWQLPADARLQHHLGGSRGSLNVRIAADLLGSGVQDHEGMRRRLQRKLAGAPQLPIYERRRLSDREVLAFIRNRRAHSPGATHSALLRQLRDAGMACEQSRFADLFSSVVGSTS